jgi:hypothetical protein
MPRCCVPFEEESRPVLTPCLLTLIDHCIESGSTTTSVLAKRMCCSEDTVRTYFKRIALCLGTHSRSEAVLSAISNKSLSSVYNEKEARILSDAPNKAGK